MFGRFIIIIIKIYFILPIMIYITYGKVEEKIAKSSNFRLRRIGKETSSRVLLDGWQATQTNLP